MANRLEDWLQFVAAQWLRANDIAFCHVANEGKRSAREGMRLIAMGMRPGVHDLIIALAGGVTLWVELKTAKGKMEPAQVDWHERLKKVSHRQSTIQTDSARQMLLELEALILLHAPQTNIPQCASNHPLDKP